MNTDVIVLFSGCGGFSEGFKQAGFNIIYANDNWSTALESHKLNHSNAEHVLADIRTLDEFPEASIVIGSPPCQNFSKLNRNKNKDTGMELVREFERVVNIIKPKYWVWENVPEVANYYKNSSLLDAYDFGLGQHRIRCFVSNFNFIRKEILPGIDTPKYGYDGHRADNNGKCANKHRVCSGTVRTKRIRDLETNNYLSMVRVKELMGFPLDYKLVGGVSLQQKQLGNAVCPPVAKVIGEHLMEIL